MLQEHEYESLTLDEKALYDKYCESVQQLASVMVDKLWHHRKKGQWEGVQPLTAFKLLIKEAAELLEATLDNADPLEVWREAADVANFGLIMAQAHEKRVEAESEEIPF